MPHPRSLLRLFVPALALALLPACKQDEAGEPGAAAKAEAGEAQAPQEAGAGEAEAGAGEAAAGEGGAGEGGAGEGGPEAGAEGEGETDTGEVAELPPVPDSFEKIGVEPCDQYAADYVACIDTKVPEAEREAQRRVVFDNVESWKQTAAGGESAQAGLQTACRIAREQAKRATQAWGCEW